MSESSVAATGTSDTARMDPSARITRVEAPIASPGSCVICGKHEHPDGFAATDNLDFEFYGTVYFCADCVGDYARVFGYISPTELIPLREQIEAQNAELNTLRQAILGLESTVDGLIADAHRRTERRANAIERSRSEQRPGGGVVNKVDEPNAGPPVPSPPKPTNVPAKPQPNAAQPAAVEGTNDLLDTTSADELLGL